MRKTITLRITKRSQPLIEQVEELAKSQPAGKDQFASMFFDILELGIRSYESGNRVIGGEIINTSSGFIVKESTMPENKSSFNYSHSPTIKNEVAKTLYPTLVGIIASLGYAEKKKDIPNERHIAFYKEIRGILSEEHHSFYNFTDKEIDYKVSILSPIIKEMVAKGIEHHHEILENNVNNIKRLNSLEEVA